MRPIGFLGLCGHLRCLRCRSRKLSCFPRVAQPAPPLAATPAPPSSGPQGGVCRLALPSPPKPSFPPLTGSPPHSNTASLLQAGDRGFPSASAATATAADDDDQVQPRPRPAAAVSPGGRRGRRGQGDGMEGWARPPPPRARPDDPTPRLAAPARQWVAAPGNSLLSPSAPPATPHRAPADAAGPAAPVVRESPQVLRGIFGRGPRPGAVAAEDPWRPLRGGECHCLPGS